MALKGNHDIFPLLFLKDPASFSDWRLLGGAQTLISYGLRPALGMERAELGQLSREFAEALPAAHADFFSGRSPSFSCGDYFFVHAGVRPGIPLDKQDEDDLLWIRQEFLDCENDFGKLIVHGHTPVKEVHNRPNRINVDTGAYATGKLSALVLEGPSVQVLDTMNSRRELARA